MKVKANAKTKIQWLVENRDLWISSYGKGKLTPDKLTPLAISMRDAHLYARRTPVERIAHHLPWFVRKARELVRDGAPVIAPTWTVEQKPGNGISRLIGMAGDREALAIEVALEVYAKRHEFRSAADAVVAALKVIG